MQKNARDIIMKSTYHNTIKALKVHHEDDMDASRNYMTNNYIA